MLVFAGRASGHPASRDPSIVAIRKNGGVDFGRGAMLTRTIPSSSESRREYARKQRMQKKFAKGSILTLGMVTAGMFAYVLFQGL
tara:strand:+ start:505 stop:759 length:255 start_codon:yes stop_codon:yes gene_type:complete